MAGFHELADAGPSHQIEERATGYTVRWTNLFGMFSSRQTALPRLLALLSLQNDSQVCTIIE
jgi:hypothetical protein